MGIVTKELENDRVAEMEHPAQRVKVLYSFPHKIGAGRICYTA
jgi:hypothetical protein